MIVIPEAVWASLLDEFARITENVERVAYLDGFRQGDVGVVTTLTIPDADLHAGHYDVSAEAMSAAGQHFRRHHMERLAQVHTHPGASCHHSSYDDDNAYSLRAGAVSIVLPHHARGRPAPTEGLIHVRVADQWRALNHGEASEFARIVPSLFDFRRQEWTVSQTGMKATLAAAWSRLTRRAPR